MGKVISEQLALFGGMSIGGDSRGVVVNETFRKAGKSYKGPQDKQGFCLTEEGQRIHTANKVSFLPLKSKEHDDMADATGLKGESLKLHNIDVRSRALREAFAVCSTRFGTGNYMLPNNGFIEKADGTIILAMKPTSVRIVHRELSNEEFIAEALKRGFVIDEVPVAAVAVKK